VPGVLADSDNLDDVGMGQLFPDLGLVSQQVAVVGIAGVLGERSFIAKCRLLANSTTS